MAVRGSIASDVRAIIARAPKWRMEEAKLASQISQEEVRKLTPIGRIVDPATGADLGPSAVLWNSVQPIEPREIKPGFIETGAYSDDEKASWIENGTKAHPIPRPGTRTVLRYWSAGELHYARSVNHPGTRGVHMFARGIVNANRRYGIGADQRLRVLFGTGSVF